MYETSLFDSEACSQHAFRSLFLFTVAPASAEAFFLHQAAVEATGGGAQVVCIVNQAGVFSYSCTPGVLAVAVAIARANQFHPQLLKLVRKYTVFM